MHVGPIVSTCTNMSTNINTPPEYVELPQNENLFAFIVMKSINSKVAHSSSSVATGMPAARSVVTPG